MARRGNPLQSPPEATARPKRPRSPQPAPTTAQRSRSRPQSEPVTGLVLRKSPARRKLEQREQEHERLLQQIASGKARCDALESLVRDAQALVHAQTEGLRERVTAALRALHRTLDLLLGAKSRLRRGDRTELRLFCQEFLGGLPRPEEPEEEQHEQPEARDGEAKQERSGESSTRSSAGEERQHASAPKPGKDTALLRASYRKLTLALHPDRASDPAEAIRLTALMKDVTRAYANEDLAQLLEIERTCLAQSASDAEQDLEARCERLQSANRELRLQLRALTERLKEGERWLPDVPWTKRDGPADAGELAARIGQMLELELRQVEGWRDSARALAEGKIGLLQFMLGPRAALEDEPLGDVVDELFGDAPQRPRSAPRRRSRR